MDTAPSYADAIEQLNYAFKYRYKTVSDQNVRMVGLVLAPPSSSLAKTDIIPRLNDHHYRSGNHIDFFWGGYGNDYGNGHDPKQHPGYESIAQVAGKGWLYNSKLFNEFRIEVESATRLKYRYSGECDLLLTNAKYDLTNEKAFLDFSSAIVCPLDRLKETKAISSVGAFFEDIFRFAESAKGDDPTWGFSDKQGVAIAGSALKRFLLSLLPKETGKEAEQAWYFAIRDLSA